MEKRLESLVKGNKVLIDTSFLMPLRTQTALEFYTSGRDCATNDFDAKAHDQGLERIDEVYDLLDYHEAGVLSEVEAEIKRGANHLQGLIEHSNRAWTAGRGDMKSTIARLKSFVKEYSELADWAEARDPVGTFSPQEHALWKRYTDKLIELEQKEWWYIKKMNKPQRAVLGPKLSEEMHTDEKLASLAYVLSHRGPVLVLTSGSNIRHLTRRVRSYFNNAEISWSEGYTDIQKHPITLYGGEVFHSNSVVFEEPEIIKKISQVA